VTTPLLGSPFLVIDWWGTEVVDAAPPPVEEAAPDVVDVAPPPNEARTNSLHGGGGGGYKAPSRPNEGVLAGACGAPIKTKRGGFGGGFSGAQTRGLCEVIDRLVVIAKPLSLY